MVNTYEINRTTLAIVPVENNMSKVIEEQNTFLIPKSPTEIVNDSCKFFGSSYQGRFEGTKSLMGISYKSPIIVEETQELIFFPTSSPRYADCCWVSLNHIKDYHSDQQKAIVSFKNGEKLTLSISYGSLENQILRATRLGAILRDRKMYNL